VAFEAEVTSMRRFIAHFIVLAAMVALGATACSNGQDAPDANIQSVMSSTRYLHSRWAMLVEDLGNGSQTDVVNADQMVVPGSSAKLLGVSALWDALGPDYRFTTPIYRQGAMHGGTLDGNLVLVASGDLTMGGRTKPDGTVDFTNFDHSDANTFPGMATLTSEDPLAGLNQLAQQVQQSGITRVNGDIVIDGRLFQTDTTLNPAVPTTPIIINDNLIDITSTPGAQGQPASVTWRPQTAAYTVDSAVTTGAANSAITLQTSLESAGKIKITGSVPAGHAPIITTYQVQDASAFARTALIEALERAGVHVSASSTGSNPSGDLPAQGSYSPSDRVAAYVSPPLSEYIKLILKVNQNLGANLSICLLAVHAGSTTCTDGLAQVATFLHSAGVDPTQATLIDGAGASAGDALTPHATVDLLSYWSHRKDFNRFKQTLPALGVDGSLATVASTSAARGHVFAKSGSLAGPDLLNQRGLLYDQSLVGYVDTRDGRHLAFAAYMNNAALQSSSDLTTVSDDLGKVAAALYG
jgi:D-alanyl-D-alanine carboxypeptidase/D-alanyl-D-alanine-endopeptidase (penicillin-binding protein 4)